MIGREPVAMIAVRQRSVRPAASIRPGALKRPLRLDDLDAGGA
jgi:hypothetical protein